MNESQMNRLKARQRNTEKWKRVPAAATADTLPARNESVLSIAPTAGEAKPFAYVADPNHPMPRTYPEWAESRRSGYVDHSPVEMGEKLARKSIYATIRREMAAAIEECSESDLMIVVEAVRLCRDLHGEDGCQDGRFVGAILQVLGFGAGHVSRSEDGELAVHSAPVCRGEGA